MRRTAYALLGTSLGTLLMIAAKLGTRPADEGVDLGLTDTLATADTNASPNAPAPPASPIPEGSSPAPGVPTTRPPGPTTAPPPPPPPPPVGLKNGTFPGTAVSERYGTIKVTIVVSGGRVTDVTATYPTGGETGTINARAIPKLRQEALTAQSANIATVSGATYTSGAYRTSLQAALNAAKA
jgi:uncharacterized protein with FMN-binding domain